jgi:hypothetical protein
VRQAYYNAAGAKACSFKQCINALLQQGVPWQDLIRWPKEQGCDNLYARKILSQVLTEAGIRRRKSGAGRETPPAAYKIHDAIVQEYGGDGIPLLLAAYRLGKARQAARTTAATFKILAA